MGVGSVVMVTVGDEAVLRDAIPVTGKEGIVLFGAPAACALDPLRLNKNWCRLYQRSIGAVVSRYAHQVGLGMRSTPIRCATPSPPKSSRTWIIASRWPASTFLAGIVDHGSGSVRTSTIWATTAR